MKKIGDPPGNTQFPSKGIGYLLPSADDGYSRDIGHRIDLGHCADYTSIVAVVVVVVVSVTAAAVIVVVQITSQYLNFFGCACFDLRREEVCSMYISKSSSGISSGSSSSSSSSSGGGIMRNYAHYFVLIVTRVIPSRGRCFFGS